MDSTQPTPPITNTNNTSIAVVMVVICLLLSIVVLVILAFNLYISKFVRFQDTLLSYVAGPSPSPSPFPSPTPFIDSDKDFISDSEEIKLGLDPNVSEIVRCTPAECNPLGDVVPAVQSGTILFIIDSSAGMTKKIDGIKKIAVVREAVQTFIKQKPSGIQVGILEYGNEGTDDISDKAKSCASTRLLAPLGEVNTTNSLSILSSIEPAGWTPLSLAIQNGVKAFKGKEGQKNQMIIIADSTDGCNLNPVDAAYAAYKSPYAIRVDIASFVISPSKQSPLMEASVNAGGGFASIERANQLLSQIQDSSMQFQTHQSARECRAFSYAKSVSCLDSVLKEVQNSALIKTEYDKIGVQWKTMLY